MRVEETLEKFASELARELIELIPKLILAIIVIVAAFAILKLVGGFIRKLLKLANVDELLEKTTGARLPVTLSSIILAVFYIGVALASLYALINIFLGEAYVEIANNLLMYGARIISLILLAMIIFAGFSWMIEKIRVESRLRGYLIFIMMLLLTAMLIDVTALSEPVKHALYTGLAIGIGASLAIFSAWFFFGEFWERALEERRAKRGRK